MTTRNLLTIFVVCSLAAAVLAKPTTTNEDHFKDYNLCHLKTMFTTLAPSEKDNTLKPTMQLMKVILFDMQNMALSYARKAKDMSDLLLKDPILISNKSPGVLKFKEDIEEYQTKYTTCSGMEELFDLVDMYSNATSKYYAMEKKGTLKSDSKVVMNVLKKYSPKDMDEEFEHEFLNTFASKMGHKINEFKENMKQEEGGMGVKILQWWDKTKSLKTTEGKMEAFKEYMKLYGMDDA